MNESLNELFRHNQWANVLIAEACLPLTPEQRATVVPGNHGAIDETLLHLCVVEERFTNILHEEFVPGPTEGASLTEIRDRLERCGETLSMLIEETSSGITREVEWHGRLIRIPVATVLTQIIHHANEHRTQIKTQLTRAGVEPPDLSAWAFLASRY